MPVEAAQASDECVSLSPTDYQPHASSPSLPAARIAGKNIKFASDVLFLADALAVDSKYVRESHKI